MRPRIERVQPLHDNVRFGQFGRRMCSGHGDDAHSAGVCRGNPDKRVFEHDAARRRGFQALRGHQENGRIRFADLHIFRSDDGVEERLEPDHFQREHDIGAVGG